jgi:prepilin-type N-terminal cleavage/methylation domain-containing protein
MRPRDTEGGFTLVELLVVLMLLGVVGSMVTAGLVSAMRSTHSTQARIEAMAELQRGAERITRELRAACPIAEIGGTDGDDVTATIYRDGEVFRHRFHRVGTALIHDVTRRDGDNWIDVRTDAPVVNRITADGPPLFAYFDADGEGVTEPRDVRVVRITLRRQLPDHDRPIEVETATSLRNGGRSCD